MGGMTVASCMEEWIRCRARAGEVGPSWQSNAQWTRKHVLAVVGDRPMDDVDWGDLAGIGIGLEQRSRHLVVHLAKAWLVWAAEEGHVALAVVRRLPRVRMPAPNPRNLSEGQMDRLRRACRDHRELVVVELGDQAALRVSEIAALEVADVDLDSLVLVVRRGKGGKRRVLPVSPRLAAAVRAYLVAEGHRSGPLIRSLTVSGAGVSRKTIWKIWTDVARRAGVKAAAGDGVSPHAMRHTAGTRMRERTGDLIVTRDFLGHTSVATTQVYTGRTSLDAMRAAVAR